MTTTGTSTSGDVAASAGPSTGSPSAEFGDPGLASAGLTSAELSVRLTAADTLRVEAYPTRASVRAAARTAGRPSSAAARSTEPSLDAAAGLALSGGSSSHPGAGVRARENAATAARPAEAAAVPQQRGARRSPPTLSRLTTAVDAVLPHRWSDRRQWSRIERAVAPAADRVQAGPFAGLVVARHGVRSRVPKILGSYEAELQPALKHVLARRPEVVVHIGAADGYYAAGIARALPQARVVAYDPDPYARALCAATAVGNSVGLQIAVRERYECGTPVATPFVPSLLILDAEPAQLDVLTEETLGQLVTTDVIVELSESSAWMVTEILHRGLSRTHEFVRVDTTARRPEQYPLLAGLPPQDRWVALEEERFQPHRWLVALSTSRF